MKAETRSKKTSKKMGREGNLEESLDAKAARIDLLNYLGYFMNKFT